MSLKPFISYRRLFFSHIKNLTRYHNNNIKIYRPFSTQNVGDIHFRQLFEQESFTYTYLLSDKLTKEGILIDPVIETVDRDLEMIRQMGVTLKYVVNTHVHADHITGSGLIKTLLPAVKSVLSQYSGGYADIQLKEGDHIKFGSQSLEVRFTPGHTNGCVTYVDHHHGFAFTGDALLIRGCGRTDFQEGSSAKLFHSVHSQIFTLPDHFLVYPAHDYNGKTVSTVEEEKKFNPRLTKTEKEFVEIMDSLTLPYPNKIDISLPANKVCGLYNLPTNLGELLEKAKKKSEEMNKKQNEQKAGRGTEMI